MALAEKIRIVLIKQKITITELAQKLGTTQNNLSNKLKRDNFSEKELRQIAEALDCDYDASFVIRDTGERI